VVDGPVSGRLEVGFGDFAFDLDELAEVRDGVERDGVVVEDVPFALLLDDRGGFEAERVEDRVEVVGVVDGGLDLAPGLRCRLDERSLVCDAGGDALAPLLAADAEGLVGLGEVAVGGVVVGVDLRDRPGVLRAERRQALSDRLVARSDLQLDLVHVGG